MHLLQRAVRGREEQLKATARRGCIPRSTRIFLLEDPATVPHLLLDQRLQDQRFVHLTRAWLQRDLS